MWRYTTEPAAYFESDRGVYLQNSVRMAVARPFGVGLGDWQTLYPVFRHHRRDFAFDQQVEVRRAHSDHAQVLAEGGFPGFLLWWAAILSAVLGGLRAFRRWGDPWPLLLSAQLVTWATAMATDYVTEMPYHRCAFFVIMGLAAAAAGRHGRDETGPPPERAAGVQKQPWREQVAAVAAALFLFAALTEALRGGMLLERQRQAAVMTRLYLGVQGAASSEERDFLLRQALAAGERVARLPGYTKTTARDERILAHLYWIAGANAEAERWLRRSLAHHPFSPAGLELAAAMLEATDPERAATWRRARDYVVHEATVGFLEAYPQWPPDDAVGR